MKRLSSESVEELFERTGRGLVSIYLPTHRRSSPPNIQSDQTRFKNLVREAADKLTDLKINESKIEDFKAKMWQYLEKREFWQNLTESLAIFVDGPYVALHYLPIETEERTYVGSKFDITPLLIIQEMNRPFYVLALAMHDSKLYKADMSEFTAVDIDLPKSVEDALNIDEMFANSNTVRGHEGTGGLSHDIGPHGQGDSSEAGRSERLQYFKIIENTIKQLDMFDYTAPFIVAATESEAGDFKSATDIPGIISQSISGNHTKSDSQHLHQQALAIIQDQVLNPEVQKLVEHYQQNQGSNRSSTNPVDIKEAAKAGRVDTLLIDFLDKTTDSVRDIEQAIIKLRYHQDQNMKQLLNVIRLVIKNGGRVVGLSSKTMPDGVSLAALYRY